MIHSILVHYATLTIFVQIVNTFFVTTNDSQVHMISNSILLQLITDYKHTEYLLQIITSIKHSINPIGVRFVGNLEPLLSTTVGVPIP